MITKKKSNRILKRKVPHLGIFFLFLLVLSTFFMIIYYYNSDNLKDFKTNFYKLYTMKSDNTSYNKTFSNVLDNTRFITLSCVLIHIGLYTEAKWYISQYILLYFLYAFSIFAYFAETELMIFNIFFILFIFYSNSVAYEDILFNSKILVLYSRIILYNCHIFLFFGTIGYFILDFIIYLLILKTLVIDSIYFYLLWILVFLWSFSFITTFLEYVSSSITIYYFINQEISSGFYVISNTFINLFYNIGNISVGKLYLKESDTFNFLWYNCNCNFDYTIISLLYIICNTIMCIITDIYSILSSDFPSYRSSYSSLFNCTQFVALTKTDIIMYEKHFLEIFQNFFIKLTYGIVLICLLPLDYYTYQHFMTEGNMRIFEENINTDDIVNMTISLENRIVIYFISSNLLIWYIGLIFLNSVSNTFNFVNILWPKFFNQVQKKFIDDDI